MQAVYLLHLEKPLSEKHTAQHYLGFAEELMPRIYAHQRGNGARFTQVAIERQIDFWLVRAWRGSRKDERKLKNRKAAKLFCPVCSSQPLDPGLEEIKIGA